MNRKYCLPVAAMFLFSACADKNRNLQEQRTLNTWTARSTNYVASQVVVIPGNTIGTQMTAVDSSHRYYVDFLFGTRDAQPAAGSYKIVRNSPAGNEVSVSFTDGPIPFVTTGVENSSVIVTVERGRLTVSLPKVWAANDVRSDSIQISAYLQQTQ